MFTQRRMLAGLLILALLAPGAAASPDQPAASTAAPAPASAPAAPGDEYWAAGFNPPGMNGDVHALAVGPDGSLYAGGDFTTAGGVETSAIARWDPATSSWHPLGSGMNAPVYALAFGPGGSLYAGGSFTTAGSKPSSYIARWTGSMPRWYLPLILHR